VSEWQHIASMELMYYKRPAPFFLLTYAVCPKWFFLLEFPGNFVVASCVCVKISERFSA